MDFESRRIRGRDTVFRIFCRNTSWLANARKKSEHSIRDHAAAFNVWFIGQLKTARQRCYGRPLSHYWADRVYGARISERHPLSPV